MKSNLHVAIPNNKIKRKNILISAKFFVEQLRAADKLKELRYKKKLKLDELNKVLIEITDAFNTLKIKNMPNISVQRNGQEIHHEEIEREVVEPKLPEKVMSKRELQLSRELDEIDRKLGSL